MPLRSEDDAKSANLSPSSRALDVKNDVTHAQYVFCDIAPLHKTCVWTQVRKIKRKSLMRDSDWLKFNLRLIFLICVQTQILCNGAIITYQST